MASNSKCGLGIGACHNKTSTDMTNHLKLDPAAGQEMANYTVIINAMLVNKTSPATSRFLTRPQEMSHMGGAIFAATTDATYQTILKWITAGAPSPSRSRPRRSCGAGGVSARGHLVRPRSDPAGPCLGGRGGCDIHAPCRSS